MKNNKNMKSYLIIALFASILSFPNASLGVTTQEMMTQLREIQNLEKQIKLSSSSKNASIKKQESFSSANASKNSSSKKFETADNKSNSSSIGINMKLKIQKENQDIKLEKKNEEIKNKLNITEWVKQRFRRIFKV